MNETQMNETQSQTHVFRKSCGCVAMLIANKPSMFVELAKAQQQAERYYGSYALMETEVVRRMPWSCEQHQDKPHAPASNQERLI